MLSERPTHRITKGRTDSEEEERGDEELLPAKNSGNRRDDRLEDSRS